MKVGSKEFNEMREGFERTAKNILYSYITSLERTDGTVKGIFYENGDTNAAFHIFMTGYGFGRINYLNQ